MIPKQELATTKVHVEVHVEVHVKVQPFVLVDLAHESSLYANVWILLDRY